MRRSLAFVSEQPAHAAFFRRLEESLSEIGDWHLIDWSAYAAQSLGQNTIGGQISGLSTMTVLSPVRSRQWLRRSLFKFVRPCLASIWWSSVVLKVLIFLPKRPLKFDRLFRDSCRMMAQDAEMSVLLDETSGTSRIRQHLIKAKSAVTLWHRTRVACLIADSLEKRGTSLCVFPEDNIVSGVAPLLIGRLQDKQIQSVVVQYTIGVEHEWMHYCFQRAQKSRMQWLRNWAMRKINEDFVRTVDGSPFSLPLVAAQYSAAAGANPLNFWSGYGGLSSLYLVDSHEELATARRSLREPAEVVLVEPIEITLARKRIYKRPAFAHKSRIVVALPPNDFPRQMSTHNAQSQFGKFLDDLTCVIKSAERADLDFIFVPHPRLSSETLSRHVHGDQVVHDIADALPSASCMIIFGSALGRLGPMLGLPVIDWDVFGYENSKRTFRDLNPAYHSVGSASEFRNALTEVLANLHGPAQWDVLIKSLPSIDRVVRDILY